MNNTFSLDDLNKTFAKNTIEYPVYPALKISQETGTIVTITKEKNEDGKWEKHEKDTKANQINMVILKKRMQFLYFDQTTNRVAVNTNEFESWDQPLHVMTEGKVIKTGLYKEEIKPFFMQNWPYGKGRHLLELKHILYVEMNGEIYRINLPKSCVQGDNKKKDGSYGPPVEFSLEWLMSSFWKRQVHPINSEVIAISVPKEAKIGNNTVKFFTFEFRESGANKKVKKSLENFNLLCHTLSEFEKKKYGGALASGQPIIEDREGQDEGGEEFLDVSDLPGLDSVEPKGGDPWENFNDSINA